MVLAPDPVQRTLYAEAIEPNLVDGDALFFGHGLQHPLRPDQAAGRRRRRAWSRPRARATSSAAQFVDGRGVPVLVAVEQDATGNAWDLAQSYAKGIGGTRAGGIKTTFTEETETDLFGEQAVLCGGASALVQAGFETLVEAGYQPEVAYFECLHELKLIVDLMYEGGIAKQRWSVSDTAEYGDYARGPRLVTDETRAEMKKILARDPDGKFAREWMAEDDAGRPKFKHYSRRTPSTRSSRPAQAPARDELDHRRRLSRLCGPS